MKNLYHFKTTSIWVTFFTWIWRINPVDHYKTMCPYFWTYVFTIIFLPFILIVKVSIALYEIFENYLNKLREKEYSKNVIKVSNALKSTSDPEILYNIFNTKCFSQVKNSLDTNLYDKAIAAYWVYDTKLTAKRESNIAKFDKIKYGIIGTIVSYLLGISIASFLVYLIYKLLHLFTLEEFLAFIIGVIFVIILIVLIFIIVFFIRKFLIYLFSKTQCNNLDTEALKVNIAKPFIFVYNSIRIIIDMIVSIYKKSCPLITWDK